MSADLYQLAFQVALMPESVSHNQSYCSEVLLVSYIIVFYSLKNNYYKIKTACENDPKIYKYVVKSLTIVRLRQL